MRRPYRNLAAALSLAFTLATPVAVRAQKKDGGNGGRAEARRDVRTVTIPVTLRLPERAQPAEVSYLEDLQVFEDGERQEILAIRGAGRSPLTLAVLIQDDLVSSVSNEIRGIAAFVRKLPPGSRVMIGYLSSGSLRVRQKFTNDLERAAKSLRIPLSSTAASPYNPFALTRDAVKRFESQPVGRRAVLVVSDGIDLSRGLTNSSPAQSLDLQLAVNEAQRLGVAVYTMYAPSVGGGDSLARQQRAGLAPTPVGRDGRARLLSGHGRAGQPRPVPARGGRAALPAVRPDLSLDPPRQGLSQGARRRQHRRRRNLLPEGLHV